MAPEWPAGAVDDAEPGLVESRHRGAAIFRFLLASRAGLFGVVTVLFFVLVALLAPLIAPHDPNAQDLTRVLLHPFWQSGGSTAFLLGTDNFGRDLLSRVIYAGRVSLLVACLAVLLSGTLGVLLGLASGFFGGYVDDVIMAITDLQLSFPFILLVIAMIVVLGPSTRNTILALAIAGWVPYARIVRAETLSRREREYIVAARVIGASNARILFRHLLPLVTTPIFIIATLEVARMIILESSLSFLGMGVQPPDASWGNLIADGREYMFTAWWLTVFPGIGISLTVMGVNLLGDFLRDAFDPRLRDTR